ncbi:HD domain-containing protein [Blautia coccoides]|uniref:HD-GYP domain-containing protein n=1 Tax=Lachnospiraceae TaxID=186803 RepID=UPI00214A4864|nr:MULTISPECIES: HD domain-containing phosphohydrolase [Lachnospiraceae]MCR1984945.1 HD domain-containing protein [Blautia coccoides]MCU0077906.1 HD domain-containing protein [Extibacter muris]
MKTNLLDIIDALVKKQNSVFKDHSDNLSELGYMTAMQVKEDWPELNLDEEFAEDFKTAITLHDIGKLKIPRKILAKPSTLTEDEYAIVQQHTVIGVDMLNETHKYVRYSKRDIQLLEMCLDVIGQHHERLDGSGYPNGLTGDEISLAAQITAVIDSYDAMVSSRVYKSAMDCDEALEALMEETDKYNIKILKSFAYVLKNNHGFQQEPCLTDMDISYKKDSASE